MKITKNQLRRMIFEAAKDIIPDRLGYAGRSEFNLDKPASGEEDPFDLHYLDRQDPEAEEFKYSYDQSTDALDRLGRVDRGDMSQFSISDLMQVVQDATDDVLFESYGDINDPYNPEANPEAVMFDIDDDPEGDRLAPGETFKLFEFDLDLQEFSDDPAGLSNILSKAKELGGITVHFRSSEGKLIKLASHIHSSGGPGPSFDAEEFAEFNLTPVLPSK